MLERRKKMEMRNGQARQRAGKNILQILGLDGFSRWFFFFFFFSYGPCF